MTRKAPALVFVSLLSVAALLACRPAVPTIRRGFAPGELRTTLGEVRAEVVWIDYADDGITVSITMSSLTAVEIDRHAVLLGLGELEYPAHTIVPSGPLRIVGEPLTLEARFVLGQSAGESSTLLLRGVKVGGRFMEPVAIRLPPAESSQVQP